ncbi:MAG: peptidylprolyl isomerase [Ferruginibacter sp.]
MKSVFIFILASFFFSCTQKHYDKPHIIIDTEYGDIEAELYPDKAPKTVAAFLKNVEDGVYDDASFYRVIKNPDLDEQYNTGLIQGGIIQTSPAKQQALPKIPHESPRQTGLTHESGVLSFARTTAGSASTEFFICIGSQKQFDSSAAFGNRDGLGYAAFGKVLEGMKLVRKIQNLKSSGDAFVYPIKINSIKKL